MIMFILFWISALVFWAYTIFYLKIFGVPKSVSDTYYLFKKNKGNNWIFSVVFMITVFSLIPVFIEYSTENTQFLAFISCTGLAFVGAAPRFKIELEGVVHVVAANICALAAILWVIFNVHYGWVVVIASFLIFGGIALKDWKNKTFWLEIAAFLMTFICVGMKLYI